MERLLLAAAIALVALGVAALIQRRRPDAPTQGAGHVPGQVDRDDFDLPDTAWALLVFTSATCATCAEVWSQATEAASDRVAVRQVEFDADRRLHERYDIDAVPLVLVVDGDGVVARWFLGPTARGEIADAVSSLGP